MGACAGFLGVADFAERHNASVRATEQQAKFAHIDAAVKAAVAKRIATARTAEATARKQGAATIVTDTIFNPSTDHSACAVSNPDSLQVIVNKTRCFSPATYAPSDLVTAADVTLRKQAAEHYTALASAATAAGLPLTTTSSFRTYDSQLATYEYWLGVVGAVGANTHSAWPGYSEHQTGLAVDVKVDGCALDCFANTPQYAWLKQYATEYGYIERYPAGLTSITGYAPEPWHWRYVGSTVAKDMKAKGIETLEMYYMVSGGDYVSN